MKIAAHTQVLAIIGDPVGHSLSPIMHNGWIADHGLDAVFVALPLRSDDPVSSLRALGKFGLKGANVTVPHKEAAARAADAPDAVVQVLGAANTLHWREGALEAHNTDFGGFWRALSDGAPGWDKSKRALIVGAGGAARGVAYAMAGPDGPELLIVNRSRERAMQLASFADPLCGRGARAVDWSELEQAFASADIIVNTTSLGMVGGPDLDWPVEAAQAHAVVCDIVYRPLETQLLRKARARGLRTVDGLGMLVHQGALAFEYWFGVKPDAALARARLLAELGETP